MESNVFSILIQRATVGPYLRTDSASFLSERQRIVSFSAFQADSASPRFVAAQSASRDPPVTHPPLHLASGVELLAGDAKPPVRRRTDSGRCRTDRVAANAGGRCVRSRLAEVRTVQRWGGPQRARVGPTSSCHFLWKWSWK